MRHVSKCFFVKKSTSGYRLVIDLKYVNTFYPDEKIKFENISMLRFAPPGLKVGAKIDLSDAYHHLALHSTIRHYF